MNTRAFWIGLLAAPIFAGCGLLPITPDSDPDEPVNQPVIERCAKPSRIVAIVDRSGSYDANLIALHQIADAIENGACPGDELFIRWIEDDSYAATAQITSTILVDLAPPPAKPSSPFEQRDHAEAMQRWSVAARAFRRQRHEVAQLLRELSPETAEASDVWGGIHKADELLANTPAGAQPVLLLATDFIDNVDRVGPFSLHGAAVRVIVYEADDPTEARARRAEWGERLLESDAASVEFRDVSESAVDILVELSSATY